MLRDMYGDYELPLSGKTLLKTPTTTSCRLVSPGSYHIGLAHSIGSTLEKKYAGDTKLRLSINIDGKPITRSSGSQFRLILGSLSNVANCRHFTIGIYHGHRKPKDFNYFFSDFINEFKFSEQHGLLFQDKSYSVELYAVICDTPARSSVKKTKGNTGCFSCGICTVAGFSTDNNSFSR